MMDTKMNRAEPPTPPRGRNRLVDLSRAATPATLKSGIHAEHFERQGDAYGRTAAIKDQLS
jgi:hypothetical protein